MKQYAGVGGGGTTRPQGPIPFPWDQLTPSQQPLYTYMRASRNQNTEI